MSGEIDADVADSYRQLRQEIEAEVNAHLQSANLGTAVEEWAFVPIITSIASGLNPEVAKFNPKKREAEFRLVIDHAAFLGADRGGRRSLLFDSLERCAFKFPEIGAKNLNVGVLVEGLRNIRKKNM